MPATPGPQPGPKPSRPKSGTNGPGDKGPSSGTKHYAPKMPNMNAGGFGVGTLKPSRKDSK